MNPRYLASALAALARHSTDRAFLRSLLASGLEADRTPRAPLVFMPTLLPEVRDVTVEMGAVSYKRSNQDPLERFFLGAYCQAREPERIFEIGTFDGTTTLLMARNAPDAEIFTLDLPPDQAQSATDGDEAQHALAGLIGAAFDGQQGSQRITQLFGDSRTFDFSPWYGTADLVVIDAGHEYEFVASDTAVAQKLLRGGGAIVWDDYDRVWPGVIRAVDETGLAVVQIENTNFALYDTSATEGTRIEL
jgi:predicted O-methyltransferase YrrM